VISLYRKYEKKINELEESNNQRDINKLQKYKRECSSRAREEVRKDIEKELNESSRHDEIVGKIGSIFLDEQIIEKTGYRLQTYEPLYEVTVNESGHSIADLLIYNDEKNIAIILEVKTGSLSGAFGEIKDIKQTVYNKSDRLKRIIGDDYPQTNCEFPLVIDQENVRGTLSNHVKNSHNEEVPLLIYDSNTLRLHETWSLLDENLEKKLKEGISTEGGSSTTITPNSHIFHILHHVLLEIFRKNLLKNKNNPKNFTKKEFKETFYDLVTIEGFEEESRFGRALYYRTEQILEEGFEYKIIKNREDREGGLRIYVRGKRDYEKLIDNIKKKWINEYIDNNWEKRAEKNALLKFENEKGKESKKIEDYY